MASDAASIGSAAATAGALHAPAATAGAGAATAAPPAAPLPDPGAAPFPLSRSSRFFSSVRWFSSTGHEEPLLQLAWGGVGTPLPPLPPLPVLDGSVVFAAAVVATVCLRERLSSPSFLPFL